MSSFFDSRKKKIKSLISVFFSYLHGTLRSQQRGKKIDYSFSINMVLLL